MKNCAIQVTNGHTITENCTAHCHLQNNYSSQSDFDLTTRYGNIQTFNILQQHSVKK